MHVDGRPYRGLWVAEPEGAVAIIDQTELPWALAERHLRSLDDAAEAITAMRVRGAPLIGVTAAYGMALGAGADPSDAGIARAHEILLGTRPTAVNLRWAVDLVSADLLARPEGERRAAAYARAAEMADAEVATCRAIGEHGVGLLEAVAADKPAGEPVQVLTHCNAGWLATVDWGTALAPVYRAHDAGLPVHVWVDETRPRSQGARLTTWELAQHGVPHTLITDNAGGQLMRDGRVDLCLVGTDRTTRAGDVANKIGTYLKALAARDNGVPFYVALPGSTVDWTLARGADIPIEERDAGEVLTIRGPDAEGVLREVAVAPAGTRAANPGFDITPAELVTGLVTERGVAPASEAGLRGLFPEAAATGQGG
jgi:methylthioribose-1-phosphate isomerase